MNRGALVARTLDDLPRHDHMKLAVIDLNFAFGDQGIVGINSHGIVLEGIEFDNSAAAEPQQVVYRQYRRAEFKPRWLLPEANFAANLYHPSGHFRMANSSASFALLRRCAALYIHVSVFLVPVLQSWCFRCSSPSRTLCIIHMSV